MRAAGERADRMRMAAALQESEERFRSIVESSLDWIWEVDTHRPHRLQQRGGARHPGVRGRARCWAATCWTCWRRRPRRGRGADPQHMSGSDRGASRLHFLDRDGATRILLSNARSLHDGAGHVLGFRGTHHDDTERWRRTPRSASSCASTRCSARSARTCCARPIDARCWTAPARSPSNRAASARPRSASPARDGRTARLRGSHGDPEVLRCIAARRTGADRPGRRIPRLPGRWRAMREERMVKIEDFGSDRFAAAAAQQLLQQAGAHSEDRVAARRRAVGLPDVVVRHRAARRRGRNGTARSGSRGDIAHACDFLEQERAPGIPRVPQSRHRAAESRGIPQSLPADAESAGPLVVAILDVRGSVASTSRAGARTAMRCCGTSATRSRAWRRRRSSHIPNPMSSWSLSPRDRTMRSKRRAPPRHLPARLGQLPFVVDRRNGVPRMSAGIALAPLHGDDGESLERNALAALAEGKKRRLRVLPFNEDMRGRAARRLELERDLRQRDRNERIRAALPAEIRRRARRRLLGAEALLRWRHRRTAWCRPADFIPRARGNRADRARSGAGCCATRVARPRTRWRGRIRASASR